MHRLCFLTLFLILNASPLLAENAKATRVTVTSNSVLVPVSLSNGGTTVQTTLMLDTGATYTVISRDIATKLNINLDKATPAKFQVIGGGLIEGWRTKVDRVTVGTQSRTGIEVAIISATGTVPFQGLLGMNFLRNFQYSIDFDNQLINWVR